MRAPLFAGLLVAVIVFLLGACREGEGVSPAPTPSPSDAQTAPAPTPSPDSGEGTLPPSACQRSQGIVTNLTLDDNRFQFTQGERISMTLSLTNCGDKPVRLSYPDSQRYDFIVQEAVGEDVKEEVWRWSADKLFAQVLGEDTIRPGETVSYIEIWDQRDQEGQPVAPERYHILGLSVGCRDEAPSRCPFGVGVFIDIGPS